MKRERLVTGQLRHMVTLHNPTTVQTSEGYTTTWAELAPPQVYAAIQPAAVRDLERVFSGAVQSSATHLITLRYHPQVTTKTRVTLGERDANDALEEGSHEFAVTGVQNPDFRNEMLILVCEEVVQ